MKEFIEKIEHIIEGNVRYYMGVSDELREEGERRLEICRGCEFFNDYICDSGRHKVIGDRVIRGCGCNLKKKVLSGSKCPLGKW